MKQLQKDFHRFLETGAFCKPPGRAACAFAHAKILETWREYETAGLVRLRTVPEEENYFDVYGKPDTEKERLLIESDLEQNGCWFIIAEVNNDGKWEAVDSVGMCVYADPIDPFENCYVTDLMAAAINAVAQGGSHDS